jgi:hypothetical protein
MKSSDVEADTQARKFLEQPDYETGGPKRRYPAGKVKRYPEEDEGREFKIPEKVLRGLGKIKKMAKGGSTSSASKRADGCAVKGKTKGRFV